jgi:PAS domain S-box-containing protein
MTFHEWIHAIARSALVPEAVGQESEWAKRELVWFHRLMEPRQYALSDGRAVEVSTSKFDSFGYVVLLHDITAVRQREQELQDRAEYNRALLDNVINAVVAIDARGQVRVFNKSAEQIFGYRAEEVIGENVKILMPESFRAQHDRGLYRYMTTGVPKVMGRRTRLQGRRKDGSNFPMELGLGEFHLAKKRQFIACIQDLTEAERMEAELRQAQKMEALGQLASGVAHDANNMLSVIFGNLELFDRTVDEDSRQLTIQFVKNAALRLEGLTQRMLAFSRRRSPSAQAIDTVAAIRSIGDLMGTLLGGRIVLDVSPAADTWPACVDLNEFETVLVNLAVNARDAMPDGGTIKFETANFHADTNAGREIAAGDYVVVSVADTGTGMSAEILRRACEPFFTTKAQGKGTGLGLSLAYGFAKKHGGNLNIMSTPGHGTTVQLFLPRHAAGAALENPPPDMDPSHQAMRAHA